MNIYFTGAGGTGKTTTAELLAPRIGYSLAPSVSRNSPFAINTPEHQEYAQNKTYEQTIELDEYVLDRTPFDVLGYDYGYGFGTHERSMRFCRNFIKVLLAVKEPIVYFPRYWEAAGDGFRPTDSKLLNTVDYWIHRGFVVARDAGANAYVVRDESPEDRVDHILEYFKLEAGE